jgi:hypothetical protein
MEAPIFLKGRARRGPTFREGVLMHAVARLALHPHFRNVQTSWVKMGPDGVRACLNAGANDVGGTLMNETITRAAGASHGEEMPPEAMEAMIRSVGRTPKQRTTLYGDVPEERVSASFAAGALTPVVLPRAVRYAAGRRPRLSGGARRRRMTSKTFNRLLSVCRLVASRAPPRRTGRDQTGRSRRPVSLTLQFDNDFFGGSDKHSPTACAPPTCPGEASCELMRRFGELVRCSRRPTTRFSFSIGQNLTPRTSVTNPPPTMALCGLFCRLARASGVWLDKLEVDLGVVGPYSFAEETQTEWHRTFGFNIPKGWDKQLKTEPGAILYYERSRRSLFKLPVSEWVPIDHLGLDFTPHFGVALGNVLTHGAGAHGAFGKTCRGHGPPKIANLPGSDSSSPKAFSCCFFGVEVGGRPQHLPRQPRRTAGVDGSPSSRTSGRRATPSSARASCARSHAGSTAGGFDNFGSLAALLTLCASRHFLRHHFFVNRCMLCHPAVRHADQWANHVSMKTACCSR